MRSNTKGFSVIEIIIVVVIVAILAVLGWLLWSNFVATDESDQTSTSIEQSEPPTLSDKQELSDSETYLNELDVDSALDTTEIDGVLE